jgi:Glycosyltransferase WbsX/Divergent InlB B-repeat domain
MRRSALLLAIGLLVVAGPAARSQQGQVPLVPIARVGMNYFDGWSDTVANFHFNGLVRPGANGRFGGREPLSGWRDDSSAVMNAELEWAHSDAVDFFEFDWFYPLPDPTLNTALGNYRRLSNHHGVGFSLLYVNIDPFVVPNQLWRSIVEDWAATDFTSPDYARVDGKPVVFVIDSVRFNEQWGGTAGVNAALETLRAAARAHGLPGVYVVGSVYIGTCVDRVGWDYFASLLRGESWDALTQNSYPAAACEQDGEQPYAEIVAAGEAAWDRYAETLGFPAIPQVQAGWDPRPWDEAIDGHLWWFARSPAQFSSFVHDAADWARAHPIPGGPLMLVNSWNELGEGQTVIPTHEDGYAYGRALAQGVGVSWSPPPTRTISAFVSKGGSIRSLPARINCPPRCATSIDNGSEVTLTAIARHEYLFRNWSGACSGRARSCSFIVDGDVAAHASFALRRRHRSSTALHTS